MHVFASLFRKVRVNNSLQWLVFGLLGLLAFYKIFSFWFYRGWEASWYGLLTEHFSLLGAMKTHGLVAYLNYSLFGWKPAGWYVTALLFHVTAAMIINIFISRKTNRTIGIIAGLLFLVTTAHHDVITWGSFESLYAVQTLCLYVGLWAFDRYIDSKRFVWYVLMVLVFLLSSAIRETGLLFIPIVFLFDLFFHGRIFQGTQGTRVKIISQIVQRHIALWITGLGYLMVRASYGGSPNDFIDERVQFSMLLLHEHRYAEYFVRGLLSFGYFIGPYLIPYPILNSIHDIIVAVLPFPAIKIYFYTSFGWFCYALLCYIVYRLRHSIYHAYLWFSLLSFTAVTAFYSFAWTVKDSFLATPYIWNENRWRYLGFTFFAACVAIASYNYFTRRKRPILAVLLLGLYLMVNILLLYGIEDKMFRENSLPAKLFYQTFLKEFPTLTNKDTFYAFPGSSGLGDFFAELNTTSKTYYPNFSQKPEPWLRTEMHYILKGMQNKESWTEQVHLVDFDMDHGVRDYTSEVRTIFSELKPVDLTLTRSDRSISATVSSAPPVDFRYTIAVDYQATPTNATADTSEKARSVEEFSSKLAAMSSDSHIDVCKTVGLPTEPNFDYRKELALDGNLSYRSFWWADCRPAWLVVDMGSVVTFSGAAWASVSKPDSVPRDYHYDVSEDRASWREVQSVTHNTQNSRIDVFREPAHGRYIRFWVDETAYGQMLEVNEFVPLIPETVSVAKFYNGLPPLYEDMYNHSGNVAWVRIGWTTTPDNVVPEAVRTLYAPIVADGGWHTVQFAIPESDYYSYPGQFLRRWLTHIDIRTPQDIFLTVNRVVLTSPYAK